MFNQKNNKIQVNINPRINRGIVKRFIIILSFLLVILFIIACSSTIFQFESSSDTPSQQREKITISKGISIKFNPEPIYKEIDYNLPIYGGKYYNIKEPFQNLITEWAKTKFGVIVDTSKNEIIIIVDDLEYDNGSNNYIQSVYMKVTFKGTINSSYFNKEIYFSRPFAFTSGGHFPEEIIVEIDQFLIQFISAFNEYIDNHFEVKW